MKSGLKLLPQEDTDLGLHVAACAQRYEQLIQRIEHIEHKLQSIQSSIIEIKEMIARERQSTLKQYLTWGSSIVLILLTMIGVLITRFVL